MPSVLKAFLLSAVVCGAAFATADCITDPSDAVTCAHYTYPYAANDMESLCHAPTGSMPYMTTCSVYDACTAKGVYAAASHGHGTVPAECALWDLVRTTCVHDSMSGMRGCSNYTKMCAAGSKVEACGTAMLTYLPTTHSVADDINKMCGSHRMSGCDDCVFGGMMNFPTNGCDMLVSYAGLCLAMPGMAGCEEHEHMCSHADANHLSVVQGYCKSGAGAPGSAVKSTPVMNMYFTTERNFYLLFKSWVPQTDSEYAGAWVAVFFMGIAVELCSLGKAWLEVIFVASRVARRKNDASKKAAKKGTVVELTETPETEKKTTTATEAIRPRKEILTDDRWTTRAAEAVASRAGLWILLDLVRFAVNIITTFGGYLLMLASMCFNAGIFVAVVIGLAVGNTVLGHFRPVHYGEGVSSMDEDSVCHCC